MVNYNRMPGTRWRSIDSAFEAGTNSWQCHPSASWMQPGAILAVDLTSVGNAWFCIGALVQPLVRIASRASGRVWRGMGCVLWVEFEPNHADRHENPKPTNA
uniref:hypothetical protein n=1 Tax=Pseudomonas aeruginosa TaxID=287 RepID=UPI00155DA572|nr:hypothetical protein [Pseudomonas aeruginosa]